MVRRCPAGDVLVILGDFNVETSSNRAGHESCLSPHGLGARNNSRQFLLEFAKSWGLWIGGSWFQRSISRRQSWYSKAGRVKKEINHILVSTRWRLMQNCRIYRSAKLFSTNAILVNATLRFRFRCCRGQGRRPHAFELERLQDQAYKSGLTIQIRNRSDSLQSLDLAAEWDTYKGKPK